MKYILKEVMMKIIYILLFVSSTIFSQNINEQIRTLQNLSPTKRVAMMNQIKKQLVLMNQQERVKTINLLKRKINPHSRILSKPKKLHLKDKMVSRRVVRENILQRYEHLNIQRDKIKRFIKNRLRRK